MQSILLYANEDAELESRLQAALDVTRAFEGHLTCLQVTPFNSFVAMDPFGGVYALPGVLDQVVRIEDAHRDKVEATLRREGISWDWRRDTGAPAQMIPLRSTLADLVVVSLPTDGSAGSRAMALLGAAVLGSRAPVLAVPPGTSGIQLTGTALVAWNGSSQAAYALRQALPILRRAEQVHLVTVPDEDEQGSFPATEGCEYLSRHGVRTELHERHRGDAGVSGTILRAAQGLGASLIVLGAYGHSRAREALLGGVTRELVAESPLPLLLAH